MKTSTVRVTLGDTSTFDKTIQAEGDLTKEELIKIALQNLFFVQNGSVFYPLSFVRKMEVITMNVEAVE